MSNSIIEIDDTKCILVFGWNPAASHPIIARRIVQAQAKGAKVIVCDPRKIETARNADIYVPLKNGSNIAFINAMANVLIEENLVNYDFVNQYTDNFDELKKIVASYTPESVESITGIKPDVIRQVARMYATSESSGIFWGMGVCQFYQGVETVRALASLALLTGQIGRPNTGVAPVRGQNNVQGACDMGALPNQFPGYQSIADKAVRDKFATAWGVESLSDKVGSYLSEVAMNAEKGKIKAFYCMGEDPLQTEPDLSAVRRGFNELELFIVQDIFMTKTAVLADVILPSTTWGEHEGVYTAADRGFQRFYKAVEPKGDVKIDWQIISMLATEMGYPMHYNNTQEIWDELRELCPKYYGVTYEKLDANGGLGYIQWPCPTLDSKGSQYLYGDGKGGVKFDTPNGKGQLFTCDWAPPVEKTSSDFPLVLSTVREVGHYSCRSMTGNCRALAALADEPGYVQISTADAKALNIENDELVWVESHHGKIITRASVSDRTNQGAVYMTYQWWIGACNELVGENLSPITKTPEYKYVPVRVTAIDDQLWAENYVQEEYGKLKQHLRQETESGTMLAKDYTNGVINQVR